jgi:23S rRNA pseudouridine1911/1915/1917 synthase
LLDPHSPPQPQPELPLEVLEERPDLLVLDKPAGWHSHPLRDGELGTLANALVARYPECKHASEDAREGGLCHRLDRETSGAIVAARTRETYLAVREALRSREVEKVYLGLVRGEPPDSGTCELPITGRGVRPKIWRSTRDGARRAALTSFRTVARQGGFALLEVRIATGVRYQIRVHLSALGFPLAGDALYRGGEPVPGLDRHLLHAWKVGLGAPWSMRVWAPLPPDAERALQALGIASPRD